MGLRSSSWFHQWWSCGYLGDIQVHVGQNRGRRRPRPIDAISGDLCINGRKIVTVSVYYGFIQRTGHDILFVDNSTIIIINKSASSKLEIARVLEHRWIQRRVTSIEGFRGKWFFCSWLCSCRSCPKYGYGCSRSLWDVRTLDWTGTVGWDAVLRQSPLTIGEWLRL